MPGSWACHLAGAWSAYDAQVSAAIEAAWEGELPSVRVRVRGTEYDIVFAEMKQRSTADPTRSIKKQSRNLLLANFILFS